MTHALDQLTATSILREQHFTSAAPVIGPLIARLRWAWYNAAARWGDRALIEQQTTYNQAAIRCIIELEERHIELERRLLLVDQDSAQLTRTVAELTQQVIQLQQAAAGLETRPSLARMADDD
jgi:hypothetical protein